MINLPKEKSITIPFFRQRLLEILAIGALAAAIGLARGLELGRFVTPDEENWISRSGNFFYALTHQDYASTYQMSHPGVTVMWVGATGFQIVFPKYRESNLGQVSSTRLHTYLEKRDSELPLLILIAARRVMVILQVGVLVLSYLFARRLVGPLPALIGFLVIAFDPFLVALSRILHLDALLAHLLLLSLLAFLVYLEKQSRLALLASAVAAGFAWLTKSPGFIMLPVAGLLALFKLASLKRNGDDSAWGKSLRRTAVALAAWTGIAALVFFLFWPAMWVNPVGTLQKIFTDALGYAEGGHESAVFFNGKIYPNGEILDSTFYPINFLWRTTPVTLLGLLFACLVYYRRGNPLSEARQRHVAIALLVFALLFMAFMNLGAKKFDRYISPAFLTLDLLAGVGLAGMASQINRALRRKWVPALAGTLLISLIAVQALLATSTYPYFFSYYNPLLGGSRRVLNVLQVGWGEGLDQAARYINSKPNPKQIRVMAWYTPGSFSYISKSQVYPIHSVKEWTEADWEEFNRSDYAVIYIHQWQRNLPPELLKKLSGQTPEYSVWIDGLEYARVYRIQ